MRLVCISDTHSMHRRITDLPEGDVLIHAGDCLGAGTLQNVEEFNDWLGILPHRHKIVIAGNHDWVFQQAPDLARATLTNAIYLEDDGIEVEGLRFWGSPWTPTFMDWAFMLDRGQPLHDHWQLIPENTDVLITHGPPHGIADEVEAGFGTLNVGCNDLLDRIDSLSLKAHIFGHIHEGYGSVVKDGICFVNASTCDERYRPINPPILIDID
ncbi:metallophosphatase domain-containing protein [Marinobacter salarius]|uniref:metallophosphatase domain-containing protein n=1 Tax=Marinobacter salarius TaxID=1420917 RepID=UPI00273B03F2|nr:metallophosphatase domain-containing protein [Marinobacter salarius]MDP4532865.1 metallophosphatase domain-containing protein [Marinobacter salarius]